MLKGPVMIKNETKGLFAILKQVIPDLPDSTTRLTLHMEVGHVPTIECEFQVRRGISIETHEQSFSLRPIDGTLVVR
jgi:hypothetical protein